MSGIYGIVRFDGAPVSAEPLRRMAAAMALWGPDGRGQWLGGAAGLGQLMLHTTPESQRERLPASIRVAPHLVITADARIDNREELFDALGAPSAGREQTPDSSLILLAYEKWGRECVRRLAGDFAFAIWDGRERRLFCARDPFGCRPFVYLLDERRFVFASDVKGVRAQVEAPRINEALLAAYLQMRTDWAEKRLTFFEGIVKLPPAHFLTVQDGRAELAEYWRAEDAPEVRRATKGALAEEMRALFEQAVKCRLRSAFPVGSHLSGGLDSSAISVVAARGLRERGERLAAYSWSPGLRDGEVAAGEDERLRIAAVCRQEGIGCEYLPAEVEDFFAVFRTDFTVNPTEMMAREAKVQKRAGEAGLRVMLSGWGGDEAVSAQAEPRKGLGGRLRALLGRRLADAANAPAGENTWLRHESPCIRDEYARQYERQVEGLRGPAWGRQATQRETICHRLEFGHITRRLEHWSASGAGREVEYRYPMLDRRLVEFAVGASEAGSFFAEAVGSLLPAEFREGRLKAEPAALAAVRETCWRAHRDWAGRVLAGSASELAGRCVEPGKIRAAVEGRGENEPIRALSGVREALGCYAVGRQT